MSVAAAPRVLFLGSLYAGHRTRFYNLKAHVEHDPRMRARFAGISGWREGGTVERLAPRRAAGRLRALAEAAPFASPRRPDAIWTSAANAIGPFALAQAGPLHRPLVLDLDWTLEQQEAWASIYFDRPPKRGLAMRAARLQERAVWRGVDVFTPWSQWAADSLRRNGVDERRVRVMPPGVDLGAWTPQRRAPRDADAPLRLLFVGGDFARKGGPLLIEAMRAFAGRCELDIVTRDAVDGDAPGVRVHRAEPNSPELKALYASSDVFVLPTRAECFGIATVEAMASGMPVIVSDVGGARDIVDDGDTGWLIAPDDASALAGAIERALTARDELPAMGGRARAVAEQRFDGARNDAAIVDLVLELVAERRARRAPDRAAATRRA